MGKNVAIWCRSLQVSYGRENHKKSIIKVDTLKLLRGILYYANNYFLKENWWFTQVWLVCFLRVEATLLILFSIKIIWKKHVQGHLYFENYEREIPRISQVMQIIFRSIWSRSEQSVCVFLSKENMESCHSIEFISFSRRYRLINKWVQYQIIKRRNNSQTCLINE